MTDIVTCSYCGAPVTWGRYADHVEVFHRVTSPFSSIAMPHVLETDAVIDAVIDAVTELADEREEKEELLEEVAELEIAIKGLEKKLTFYAG